MDLNLNEEIMTALKQAFEESEDCEAISPDEYIVDVYDNDPPMTIDLEFTGKKIGIVACAKLLFDEEMDGWYMGERLYDTELIKAALMTFIK